MRVGLGPALVDDPVAPGQQLLGQVELLGQQRAQLLEQGQHLGAG